MNGCADSTMLRSHLDRPDAALDAHLDTCPTCAGLLNSVAEDAGVTRRALTVLDADVDSAGPAVDVEAALVAALTKAPAPAPPPVTRRRRRRPPARQRLVLSGAAAVVVLTGALTPVGRGAVAGVLDVVRGQRLQVVSVDPVWASSIDGDDVRALEALGRVDTGTLDEPRPVTGRAEAESVAGITAPTVAEAPERYLALAPGTVRLTLAARPGNGVPSELDGAALVVNVPGAIGAVYGPPRGVPQVVIGRSGPLVVRAEGAPLEAIRSFLLGREELPADLRTQLAAIGDWRSTIPVPAPVGGPGWKDVEVAGRPAIAFGDDSGVGALVIRQDADGVTVAGGRIPVSRAIDLASGA
jgi:hypothetical protein